MQVPRELRPLRPVSGYESHISFLPPVEITSVLLVGRLPGCHRHFVQFYCVVLLSLDYSKLQACRLVLLPRILLLLDAIVLLKSVVA